jgi:hypothetical protein
MMKRVSSRARGWLLLVGLLVLFGALALLLPGTGQRAPVSQSGAMAERESIECVVDGPRTAVVPDVIGVPLDDASRHVRAG